MIPPRQQTGHGARGKPADAVGDQPFACTRHTEIAAEVAAKIDVVMRFKAAHTSPLVYAQRHIYGSSSDLLSVWRRTRHDLPFVLRSKQAQQRGDHTCPARLVAG